MDDLSSKPKLLLIGLIYLLFSEMKSARAQDHSIVFNQINHYDVSKITDLSITKERKGLKREEFTDQLPELNKLIEESHNTHPLIETQSNLFYYFMELQNLSQKNTEVAIYTKHEMHVARIYFLDESLKPLNGEILEMGSSARKNHRNNKNLVSMVDIKFAADESKFLVLEIEEVTPIDIRLTETKNLQESIFINNVFVYFFMGLVIGLIIYNGFLYLALRENIYLFYIGILICQHIVTTGQRFGATGLVFGGYSFSVFLIGTTILPFFLWKFISEFCQVIHYTPKLGKWFRFAATLNGTLVGIILLLNLPFMTAATPIVLRWIPLQAILIPMFLSYLPLVSIALVAIYIIGWKKKYRPARFFGYAWAPVFLSVPFWIMASIGIVDSYILSNFSIPIGSVFEALILSFGLADKHKTMKANMLAAEQKLHVRLSKSIQATRALNNETTVEGAIEKAFGVLIQEISALSSCSAQFVFNTQDSQDPASNKLELSKHPKPVGEEKMHQEIWVDQKHFGTFEILSQHKLNFKQDEMLFLQNIVLSLESTIGNIQRNVALREKAKMDSELEKARELQSSLLATQQKIPNLDIASYYQPAEKTGGDWFGWYQLSPFNGALILCGDVTGHGLSAAMITAVAKGSIESILTQKVRHLKVNSNATDQLNSSSLNPQELLSEIIFASHQAIINSGADQSKAMTLGALLFDFDDKKAYYCNAGHDPIVFMRNEKVKFKNLPSIRLGGRIKEDYIPKTIEFELESQDTFILYTDGYFENTSTDGVIINRKQFSKNFASNRGANSQELLDKIVQLGNSTWKGHIPEDDIAILVCRYHQDC